MRVALHSMLAGWRGRWPFRDPVTMLPERVRVAVEQQSAEGERLIGWAQLTLAVTFAGLYAVAPRPADARMLAPVPIALALYGLFTAGRLTLSYVRRLPEALLALSSLADVVLLLWLIWSFHAAYGQAAAFSLKIPTFAYVFVFVALRALRFECRYVAMTGLVAACGWVVVTALAVRADGTRAITRSFVDYVSGSGILIGAELDKVVAIAMVTAILSLSAWRAQAMLVRAVREETKAREIGRFLSRGIAEVIAGAEVRIEAGSAVDRHAAILMLDIRGFTRMSMVLPAGEVLKTLGSLHARIVPLIQAHGGVVDKFLGDGVMATFGAVAPSATADADAVRALEAIMDEARRWGDECDAPSMGYRLELNGALASGPVVFATLGSAERLEYTVIGEAVNLAAKLEKHNKSEGTRALVEAQTYRRAVVSGYAPTAAHEVRGGCRLHGVDHTVDVVVLR